VETDKVNTEIPSPASGVLLKIVVPDGATVKAGTVLALIGQPDEGIPELLSGQDATPVNGWAQAKPSGRAVITPVVARIAAEHGIDLASVDIRGSGREGRITKKDLLAYIERGKEEAALEREVHAPRPPTPPLPGQVVPLTSMRQSIAQHMMRSLHGSAQATTVMEADMSRVVTFREKHEAEFQRREGLKLTFTPFFVQAVVEGLKAVPIANSSLTEEGLRLHSFINIGLAVALESGLMVPVVQAADQLSLSDLQRAVTDLAHRARTGQLKPDEVQGSTFTLTNHGVTGSLLATPIINQPNAGILGIGAIQKRPVVVTGDGGDSIAIKPMCYLSFTFDHRIMDGALADRFLARVVAVLEDWG
jgi:2-oxoglutarate dehydrogenase E2 component (dihydrolipoamide succinyltransferase)